METQLESILVFLIKNFIKFKFEKFLDGPQKVKNQDGDNNKSFLDKLFLNPGFDYISNKILGKLNAKDLASCRLVNQTWRKFIDNNKQWFKYQIEYVRRNQTIYTDTIEDKKEEKSELIESRSPEWKTIFEHFIKNENTENLKKFTGLMWKYFNTKDKSQGTPLHFAVEENLIDAIEMLQLISITQPKMVKLLYTLLKQLKCSNYLLNLPKRERSI